MSKKKIRGVKTPSRRKFFKVAAATGAAAAATVAMPNVAFGAPKTLKMQAAGLLVQTYSSKWQAIMPKWFKICLAVNLKLTCNQLEQL